jgi:hypothetical protein
MPEPKLSRDDLEKTRRQHLRDLRLIEKMSDEQFEGFKRNFSLGVCDPRIRRREAIEVLKSMIMTNLTLQRQREGQIKSG